MKITKEELKQIMIDEKSEILRHYMTVLIIKTTQEDLVLCTDMKE